MNGVFADAQYWVAILNEKDQGHAAAEAISRTMQGTTIVTTEEVLTEVLAFFSERGRFLRQVAAAYIADILSDPEIIVLPQSHQTFREGFALYQARPDKGYSLTDCISMLAMRREGISEVLSHDGHFTQEGFVILL
jgi:predicted nucleic acid-binding protein